MNFKFKILGAVKTYFLSVKLWPWGRLILLAEILAYNKSALCRSATPEFQFCFISHFKWRLATASLWWEIWQEELVSYIYALHGPLLSNSFNNLLVTENLSRITISINQPHRSRRTSHYLVLIFPIWSCMSCNKLLQSHLLRHFHYLNGISRARIWLLNVLYLVVCMLWYLVGCMSCTYLVGLSFNPFLMACNPLQQTTRKIISAKI